MRRTTWVVAILMATAFGCDSKRDTGLGDLPAGGPGGGGGVGSGGSGPPGGGDPVPSVEPPQSVSLSGHIIDFGSQAPLAIGSVSAWGVWPVPQVDLYPGSFTVQDLPQNATLTLVVTSDGHVPTCSMPITVGTHDLGSVDLPAVSASFITGLASKLSITARDSTGVVLVQLSDANGLPLAGVAGSAFMLDADADGPYMLDAEGVPVPGALATTSSGRAAFFNVTPGRVTLLSTDPKVSINGAGVLVTKGGAALSSARVIPVD